MRHPLFQLAQAASLGMGALDVATRNFVDVTDTYYNNDTDIGYGAQLKVGQGDSPETFVAVKGVVEIKLAKFAKPRVKRTHLRSPDRAHEYTTGLTDYEAIMVKVNWDPNHGSQNVAGGTDGFTGAGLLGLMNSGATRNFRADLIIAESPYQWNFPGKVLEFEPPTINAENLMEATFAIQATTYTAPGT